MKNFTSILVLLLFTYTLSAQNINKQVESYIAEKYQADGPGGAILISKKGKTVYEEGFGKANLELDLNNTPNNVFEIGSISKQFTAVAILMLEEDGKLNVTDPISKYLKDYPKQENEITIHQLLTHTAGIPNYTSMPSWMKVWRQDMTTQEVIDIFKNEPLDFVPGTNFSYSNSGYVLLGAIIEKVSKKSYAEFIQERIFTKIGLNHTYYGSRSQIIPNRACGYQPTKDGFINAEYLSFSQPHAAGAIMSTVEDQNTWIHAIANNTLISEESKQKAWKSYTNQFDKALNYGYGWVISQLDDKKTVEHGGGIFGFTSYGIYIPSEDVFVSILTNRDGFSPESVAIKSAAAAINFSVENPPILKLSAQQLKEYEAVYAFEDGTTRTITVKEDHIFSVRTGGSVYEIFPYQEDKFFFNNSFTRLTFKRNGMHQITAVVSNNRGVKEVAKKTDQEISVVEEIALDPKALEKFVGEYELDPNFIITVSIQNGKLFGQATGQPAFELYAKSELEFFLKVVDAQVEFVLNDQGDVAALILHQGGQDLKGVKK